MENNLTQIEAEILNLRDTLNKANKAYYVDAIPVMEDTEYDGLFDRLKELEEKYPQFYDDTSPTVRIGSDIDNTLPEKAHTIPVLSLDKCYLIEDLLDWIEKNEKKFPDQINVTIEPKIDGTGVVLYYNNGKLTSALTRGNGYSGNDITENIKTIKSIPLKINYPGELAVRGEIYIKKIDFENFNNKYANGAYANPRNLASGCVRRQKSKETALFPLNIFLYEGFFKEKTFDNHLDNLIFLKELGFPLNNHFGYYGDNIEMLHKLPFKYARQGEINKIRSYIEYLKEIRNDLQYEIDGLVIKINDLRIREELGFTRHHPRWAIAYKFDAPLAQTKIISITTQVGRGGRITPVANLEPVKLSGSVISRATLHNQDYINSLGVNNGDLVSISKRGDVIPAVEEVLEKGENSSPHQIEKNCPACQQELIQEGAHLFCFNDNCPRRLLGTLQHFVSKRQMDVDSLGDKTLEFLFSKNHIKYINDIYEFDYQKLIDYEGFKEKKITNIINAVKKSKEKNFAIVLSSLGLKDIGSRAAELLTEEFKDIDTIIQKARERKIEDFSAIEGIGEILAKSIIKHFTDEKVINLINKLKTAGLNFKLKQVNKSSNQFLSDTKWVVTGSFTNFKPRDKAKELIKNYGGEVLTSISAKTTFLLCGKEAGSKLEKAKSLGIKIIEEDDFITMIKQEKYED